MKGEKEIEGEKDMREKGTWKRRGDIEEGEGKEGKKHEE